MAINQNGRGKNVTGTGKPVAKRGDGLNSGPVGRQEGYSGRPTANHPASSHSSYQGGQRASVRGFGIGKLLLIVVLAFVVLGGGKLSGLLSGLDSSSSGGSSSSGIGSLLLSGAGSFLGGGSSSSSGLDLSSLLGGFSGGSSVSSGWARSANTGKLDTTVAASARAKRTQILGGGQDKFTIMVYMCGTDLESKSGMASNDLQEMAKASLNSNVNIIVYTGGCKQWRIDGISNTVNQIYKVENGALKPLVTDDGKESLVKPATLTRFIQYCTSNYPANRQALIFWDHGGGSVSGYGYDEKNANLGSMGLSGIRSALQNAGTTFDFIGFDACLMATLETGLMLDDYADYLIASEETEPGIGWYYTNWLTKLSADPSMSTIVLGQNIVDDFVDECNRRCAGQKTTLSVIDLAELSATVPDSLKSWATDTSKHLAGTDYKTVSDARSATREFAASSKIDQIDLVHLCYNLNNTESEKLAKDLLGAVKYNKTSSSMSNAYGLSIYFPYQRKSYVNTAVSTYDAIGLDSSYSRCIQQFANLEAGGQASSNSSGFSVGNLMNGLSSSSGSVSGAGDIGSLLSGLLGSGDLFGREIDLDTATQTISANQFDASRLQWTQNSEGMPVMNLPKEQWSQVHDLLLNVFYDDGEGYIDLGLDTVYSFTQQGELVGEYDCTWVAINNQPVPFYFEDTTVEGSTMITTGLVPCLLNGERAKLLLVFENNVNTGDPIRDYIAGVRFDYVNGETEAVAKNADLVVGDKIEFVCDYYGYDGSYSNSYLYGEEMRYAEDMQVSYVVLPESSRAKATYLFRDIYNEEYWTAPMTNIPYQG
ncbi:MAG: peptidase C11 [Oscillospiraceae bacterium]|nr:peptidase C11 [Oscillospiraceae bacterium]